jgi:RNA polymerase sigma factor (sigma-70 family)
LKSPSADDTERGKSLWDFLTPDNLKEVSRLAMRTSRRYGRNTTSPDDLAQEAIRRVLEVDESAPLYFHAEDDFLAWISAVLRNVAREAYRHKIQRNARQKLFTEHEVESKPDVRELTDKELVEAISTLPSDEQVVIEHRLQGLSYAQIATRIGTTEAAVRQRYSRGTKRLARHFGRS